MSKMTWLQLSGQEAHLAAHPRREVLAPTREEGNLIGQDDRGQANAQALLSRRQRSGEAGATTGKQRLKVFLRSMNLSPVCYKNVTEFFHECYQINPSSA